MQYHVIMSNDQPLFVIHSSYELAMNKAGTLQKQYDKQDGAKNPWNRKRIVNVRTVDGEDFVSNAKTVEGMVVTNEENEPRKCIEKLDDA